MKQKIYIATLLAGMLALAGCGGGSSSTTTDTTETDPPKTYEDGLEEGKKEGRMDAEQEQKNAEANRTALALYTAIDKAAITHNAGSGSTTFEKAAAGNKASDTLDGEEGKAFSETYATHADDDNNGLRARETGNTNTGFYELQTGYGDLIKSDEFSTSSNPKKHTTDFAGTFNGVKGMFRCTGDACFSAKTTDGIDLQTISGTANAAGTGWFFKPDNPAEKVGADELAEFGWWIEKDGTSGDVEKVHLYYAVDDDVDLELTRSGTIEDTGKATYEGTALGKYAIRGSSPEHGHFTADATLTADFNVPDADATDGNVTTDGVSLSGTIDNFKVGDDNASRTWVVTLSEDVIADDATSETATLFAGKTTLDTNGSADGGKPTLDSTRGDWQAHMYSRDTNTVTDGTNFPTHVLGGFNAEHDDARMAGSFGAAHKP